MPPRLARAAVAGTVAAAAWVAAEPLAQRLFRTPYSDVRLLGAPISRRHWRAAGITIHLANGAAAGLVFERLGLRGWKAGVVVFQAENLVAWPLTAIVDRFHPDRRSGAWPPLLHNGRVFGQEATVHALFGAVLGSLVTRAPRNS
jgi:hypothetical protein